VVVLSLSLSLGAVRVVTVCRCGVTKKTRKNEFLKKVTKQQPVARGVRFAKNEPQQHTANHTPKKQPANVVAQKKQANRVPKQP
jgi:hypothetical protein